MWPPKWTAAAAPPGRAALAAGVVSIARVPSGVGAAGPGHPWRPEVLERYDLVPQGISAELVARKYGVTRREMDEFSVRSHHRAAEATSGGRLSSQLLPVEVPVDGRTE